MGVTNHAQVRRLFDAHYAELVARSTPLIGADAAHEVVTEAFSGLLRQRTMPRDPFLWLRSTIASLVRQRWRAQPATPHPETPAGPPEPAVLLRELPERLRQTGLLHWYGGLGVDDIAGVSGHSPTSVERLVDASGRALGRQLRELSDGPEPPEGVDQTRRDLLQVEQYFAEQRARLRPVPAPPDRWEQIVHQADDHRAGWLGPTVVIASVLSLLLIAYSWRQAPFEDSVVARGGSVSADDLPGGTPGQVQEPATSAAQASRAVPTRFVPWSLGHAGSGTLFGLGSADCATEEICPTLVRSTDNGTSWVAVHTFRATDTAGLSGDEVPRVQPDRAISEVRFADPRIGYAFGGSMWRTADGGRSFTEFAHPGETVLDVEVSGAEVTILTADGCTQGSCTGPLRLIRAGVEDTAASTASITYTLPAAIDDADVVQRDGVTMIDLSRIDRMNSTLLRVDGRALVPVSTGKACAAQALQALTVTDAGAAQWFALCGRQDGSDPTLRLIRSTDAGRTWQPAPGSLTMPLLGRVGLAAADPGHLVASAGGPRPVAAPQLVRDPARLLQVTSDGGNSWRTARAPEPPSTGFDRVIAPAGDAVYGITRATGGMWRSDDRGATWSLIDPAVRASQNTNQPSSTSSRTSGRTSSGGPRR